GVLKRSGIATTSQRVELALQGRDLFQSWDIEVPLEAPLGELRKADLQKLVAALHAQHAHICTIKDEADTVEFNNEKVRAIGDTGGIARGGLPVATQGSMPRPKGKRKVYLGKGFRDVPVHDGERIGSGATLAGPAIIEQPTTTILLLEGQ